MIAFAEEIARAIPPAVEGFDANLGEEQRFGEARGGGEVVGDVSQPRLDEAEGILLLLAAIPAGVGVDGDDVHKVEALVLQGVHGGEGDEARGVERTQHFATLLHHAAGLLGARVAFVEEPPEDDAGVVDALAHHVPEGFAVVVLKERVGQELRRGAPAEVLLPDEEAQLVAQRQEPLILRVVAAADEVCAELLEDAQVGVHALEARGRSRVGRPLVAVDSDEADCPAVEKESPIARLHPAQAKTHGGMPHSLLRQHKLNIQRM